MGGTSHLRENLRLPGLWYSLLTVRPAHLELCQLPGMVAGRFLVPVQSASWGVCLNPSSLDPSAG